MAVPDTSYLFGDGSVGVGEVRFEQKQLRKKFKHVVDFGIDTKKSNKDSEER